jgi:hypothetical protein
MSKPSSGTGEKEIRWTHRLTIQRGDHSVPALKSQPIHPGVGTGRQLERRETERKRPKRKR